MLALTRLDGQEFYLNPDLMERIEATPDTVVTLVDGRKLVVREAPQELARRVLLYRQEIARGAALVLEEE